MNTEEELEAYTAGWNAKASGVPLTVASVAYTNKFPEAT